MGLLVKDTFVWPIWMQEVAVIHPQSTGSESTVDLCVTVAAEVYGNPSTAIIPYYFPGRVFNLRNVPIGGQYDWITKATNEAYDRSIAVSDNHMRIDHFDDNRPRPRNRFGSVKYPIKANIVELLGTAELVHVDDFARIPLHFGDREGYKVGRFGFSSTYGFTSRSDAGEALWKIDGPYSLMETFSRTPECERIAGDVAQTLHDIIVTGDNSRSYDVVHKAGVVQQPLSLPEGQDLSWLNYFLAERLDFVIQIMSR